MKHCNSLKNAITYRQTDVLMRLPDITRLTCLFCVLMVLYVNSQSSSCTSGWFGTRCQYKCRCVNDSCDASGMCTDSVTCQAGWFGPACQYADLAYLQTGSPVFTDGDDSTCNNAARPSNITISLKEKNIFTWMRVLISDQAYLEPTALDELMVSFSVNKIRVKCNELTTYVVDALTRDIHCNLTQAINSVTLSGQAVSAMCSVYVSGGRNVALKENAYQDFSSSDVVTGHPINLTANLAVDGKHIKDIPQLSCEVNLRDAKWSLNFSTPRNVQRYVIYNTWSGSTYQSIGFKLESFDNKKNLLFTFRDTSSKGYQTYQIIHGPLPIQTISITFKNKYRILQLCELEVYGDSICDNQHYGRDCENTCNCMSNETCLVSTGGCTSGCAVNFYGYGCHDSCHFGIVNEYCNMPCGKNCVPFPDANVQPCSQTNGECILGCMAGFSGQLCQTECALGTFGERCKSLCSANCVPSGDAKISPCNSSTGTCLRGCKNGFEGEFCQNRTVLLCPPGKFGENCNSSCSNCEADDNTTTCDSVTGECLNGCTSGFSGALCQTKCDIGKFGANCSSSCSHKCEPIRMEGVSDCDHVTGQCYRGCQFGYYGDLCLQAESVASEDTSSGDLIVGLCLLVIGISFVSFCFLKRKGGQSHAESLSERRLERQISLS